MKYGFELANSSVPQLIVQYDVGEKYEQTFDNLPDARKAAALATDAMISMLETCADCNLDTFLGMQRDIDKIFADGGSVEEIRDKVQNIINQQIETAARGEI